MPRLLCVALVATAAAFDVSWIPADPDGPLPLSKAYRENLKRLCDVVRTVKPLPPSIVEKLPVIEKLCAKLEMDSYSEQTKMIENIRLDFKRMFAFLKTTE